MSNNTAQQDKEHADFVNNFLPRFAAETKMKRGTNRDFFVIASLPIHVYEDVIKNTEKPEKVNWQSVHAWYKKYRKKYGNYQDFLNVASKGRLKD